MDAQKKLNDEVGSYLRNHQSTIQNLELQVGRVSQMLSERTQGELPTQTQVNPKVENVKPMLMITGEPSKKKWTDIYTKKYVETESESEPDYVTDYDSEGFTVSFEHLRLKVPEASSDDDDEEDGKQGGYAEFVIPKNEDKGKEKEKEKEKEKAPEDDLIYIAPIKHDPGSYNLPISCNAPFILFRHPPQQRWPASVVLAREVAAASVLGRRLDRCDVQWCAVVVDCRGVIHGGNRRLPARPALRPAFWFGIIVVIVGFVVCGGVRQPAVAWFGFGSRVRRRGFCPVAVSGCTVIVQMEPSARASHWGMVTTRRGNSRSEEPDLRDLIGSEVQEVLQQLLPGLFAQMKDEILQAMDERMEAAFTARGSASGSNSQAQSRASTFKDFMACQPPHFEGRKDPIVCYRWIAAVEGAFRTCSFPEGMKVFFAANLLRDAGKDWWGLILKSHTEEQITAMTWDAFKVLFDEQFSPRVERERIIAEFLNLKQTTESVNEITNQFLEKALFCPDYVSNETMRMYRYRGVLKPEIREFVSTTTCTSFNAMVEAARTQELFLAELQQGKRKAEQSLVPARKFKGQRTDGRKVYSGCPKCGRNHQGECRLPEPVCYKCGKSGHKSRECGVPPRVCFNCFQPGHIKPNCPKLAETPAKAQVKAPAPATLRITDGSSGKTAGSATTRGRAFQMTADEAQAAPDVVTVIHGVTFTIDLIPIPMNGIDVIAGVDWMFRNGGTVDCAGQLVRIQDPSGGELIVYGKGRRKQLAFCSVAKARRWLQRGCKGYLAYAVIDLAEERKTMVF
ncbi:hypothetical protein OSB04_010726 [Centaurea solstitialis]|uniref:CCHC-type domain-containing protein n=1 Tax=Centaurea solstitialis TaxID=347529 RepID=A0AA38WD31_9ASTR|nr:hypothetical protein OSB04_010726 [Centaurea solstitialis]